MADLSQVKPKETLKVIDAYVQTLAASKKDPNIKVPRVALSLSNNTTVTGVITQCDFQKNLMAVLEQVDRSRTLLSFVDIGSIVSIGMQEADLCPEFLDKLSKV